MAQRRSRTWWQAQVAALEASGQAHREFAQARGVALASLRHWLYAERRARVAPALAAVPAMVEVQWSAAEVIAAVGGIELRVSAGTDAAWLADLLGRLARGSAPC